MEHNVFRDLAPAYIDGLTSEETNEQLEKHMEECEECRSYLNEMKEDLFLGGEKESKKEKGNIDYFKKVRNKNRKKILVIVSSILSVFLILITTYYFMFVDMRLAGANNIETNVQNQDKTVSLSFEPKKSNRYLIIQQAWNEGYVDSIFVYEMREGFSTPEILLKGGFSIPYTFLDENTLLVDNGKKQKIKDTDTISIHYRDRTEKILVKDLYDKIKK